jgi:TolB-like protein/Flp pilus assembly protein TadD
MATEGFWKRLLERKMVQWAIAYIAGAVGLLQFAEYLASAFAWPVPTLRVLTVVVAFGFLAVLIIAWYHGERGHQRVKSTEVILLVLVVLAAAGVSWRVAAATAVTPLATAASPTDSSSLALVNKGKGIAVLPFANVSANPENEYFSDAITEDIIAALSQYPSLRVISRTSMMQYKNTTKAIPQIGDELRVDYVLEGSVQREGNEVRIHAQLIDVRTDAHIWTNTYDRNLRSILALQREVSHEIARRLSATVDPTLVAIADTADLPNVDPAAYMDFLKGRGLLNSQTAEDKTKGLELVEQAVTKDVNLVTTATASLARAELPADQTMQAALTKIDSMADRMRNRGTQRGPNALEIRIFRNRSLDDRDLDAALDTAKKLVTDYPNNASVHQGYAMLLGWNGQFAEGLTELRKAEAIEPTRQGLSNQLGEFLYASGQYDDAISMLHKSLAGSSRNSEVTLTNLGMTFQAKGQTDSAIVYLKRAAEESERNPIVLGALGYVYAASGRGREARALLDTLRIWTQQKVKPVPPVALAQIQAGFGNMELALRTLRVSGTDARTVLPPRVQGIPEFQKNPGFQQWMIMVRDSMPTARPPRAGGRGNDSTPGRRGRTRGLPD